MKGQLEHECSLRATLEQSHVSLLDRIRDLESVVQTEREQVLVIAYFCTVSCYYDNHAFIHLKLNDYY